MPKKSKKPATFPRLPDAEIQAILARLVPTQWVDTHIAAALAGYSHRTFEKLRFEGGGPPFASLSGTRGVRYLVSDVQAWMRSLREAA